MDTETGASICLLFVAPPAPAPPPPVAAVDVGAAEAVAGAVGTVSHGHTEQLALASECTSNVSASVFTDSLGADTHEHIHRGKVVDAMEEDRKGRLLKSMFWLGH